MSPVPARLIFPFLLVVNCLLWSRSRYAQPSPLIEQSSLVRRISYQLANPQTVHPFSGKKECRPLEFPITAQCRHAADDCPPSDTFLGINYLHQYLCTDVKLRPLAFTGLLVWLVFLFSTLGISASDFFTPNLASIAQLLGLDENVAGVTLLAFGNGSPDVFSTFSAMRAGSGSLAIGELVGAASFIVSCVVGSMCIIKPFRVHPRPFLRDVCFFAMAVAMMLVILWDGLIFPWEAGMLIGLYLVYVFTVIVGTWWERKQERKRQIEAMIRAEYEDEPILAPYTDNDSPPSNSLTVAPPSLSRARAISAPAPPRIQTNLPPRPYSRTPSPSPSQYVTQLPSFSLVGALEFREVVASLQRQAAGPSLSIFESPVTPYAGGHYHSHPLRSHSRSPRTSLSSQDDETLNGLPLNERPRRHLPSPSPQHLHPHESADYFTGVSSHGTHTPVPSIFRTPASPTISDGESEVHVYIPPTRRQRVFNVLGKLRHTLFPTLHHFREQSLLGQIACLFAAPAVSLLTLTLPVVVTPYQSSSQGREKLHHMDARLVDFEEEGIERVLIAEEEVEENLHEMSFNKWLMAAQCIFGPLFCVGVLFGYSTSKIWLPVVTLVSGLILGTLVAVFADKGNHPTARIARCSMGFFVSIVWIMAIADEVVNVLQTFGFIFGLSDAIIGLTIFAVGNSLADLVANMSVAVFAPIMGFSACFGGPMLNILLGVGISGSYVIHQNSEPYALELSHTLLVSSIGLLVLLAATLIFVPLNDYFLTRRWGILLIFSYTIIMIINIVVELHSSK